MLRQFWIDVYVGAPDYIITDAETSFNSSKFKEKLQAWDQ